MSDLEVEIDEALATWSDGPLTELLRRARCALSQQDEPVEPAPAQDERDAFEERWAIRGTDDEGNPGRKPLRSLVDQQRYRGDAVNGSWVWFQRGAAWQRTRPAQAEQQPSTTQQILDLIMEQCRYWHGRDEARRGGFACLYAEAKAVTDAAPIAQTAPSCNHRFMYFGDQTKRRCADCYVVEGNEQTAEAEGVEVVAYADPKAFENFKTLGSKGGVHGHEWMWAKPDGGLVGMVRQSDHLAALSAVTAERDAANSRLHEVAVACAEAEQERDQLSALIAECVEYPNTNRETSISSGSVLHRKLIAAMAAKEG